MNRKRDRPYNSSLGSKIDLLFGASETQPPNEAVTPPQTLPISQLKLPNYQPRQYFDPEKLEELAQTIRRQGILEPLLVRPIGKQYEVVAGGRRYRAALLAELSEVSVVIKELDDKQALELSILENVQREDLNPVEVAEGILKLLEIQLNLNRSEVVSLLYRMHNEAKGKVTRNVSGKTDSKVVEEIFAVVGVSWKSFVETKLALLNKPEDVLDAVRSGQLAYTKAMALAKLKDSETRQQLLDEAVEQNLSLTQIKERIKELQSVPKPITTPQTQLKETYHRLNKSKLWEKNPKKWKRVQDLFKKMEALLEEE
ncbi:MAG: ParB/RepB/Spo0J family partition protein [Microcoleaceae cyanobacterium]